MFSIPCSFLLEPQDLSKGHVKQQHVTQDDDDSENEDEDTDVEMDEEVSRGAEGGGGVEKAVHVATSDVVVYEPAAAMDPAQSVVRPQIIVTPRKMASAIESATAAVLAKNRKTSLEECATTNEVPLEFIPVCVFGANRKNAATATSAKDGGQERSSSKTTVIVRAGCSSVS